MIEVGFLFTYALTFVSSLPLIAAAVLAVVSIWKPNRGVTITMIGLTFASCLISLSGWGYPSLAVTIILVLLIAVLGGAATTRLVLTTTSRVRTVRGSAPTRNTLQTGPEAGVLDGHSRPINEPARIDDDQLLRGGATIGYLERLLTAIALIAGSVAAVAVIVAIKGLGRFTDLVSSAARERFIVGTLASLGWATISVMPAILQVSTLW